MVDQLTPQYEQMPHDLYAHLSDLDPRSHAFRQDFEVLNALVAETGLAALTLEDIFPPVTLIPPEGFSSEVVIPGGAELPVGQFKGVLHSLHSSEAILTLDLHRLVSDTGKEISLCDLRPFMTSSVRKGGPKSEGQKQALDRAVYRDLKFRADNDYPKRSVTHVPGVNYTRLSNGLERAYWMVVNNNAKHGTTVARIADSDTKPGEEHLYWQVFRLKL